jgi:hypothetical protein
VKEAALPPKGERSRGRLCRPRGRGQGGGQAFKKLLVGADNSATALRAVEAAVELAQAVGAKLHIVTAYKPQAVRAPDLSAEFLDANHLPAADSLLEDLISVAKRANVGGGGPCCDRRAR